MYLPELRFVLEEPEWIEKASKLPRGARISITGKLLSIHWGGSGNEIHGYGATDPYFKYDEVKRLEVLDSPPNAKAKATSGNRAEVRANPAEPWPMSKLVDLVRDYSHNTSFVNSESEKKLLGHDYTITVIVSWCAGPFHDPEHTSKVLRNLTQDKPDPSWPQSLFPKVTWDTNGDVQLVVVNACMTEKVATPQSHDGQSIAIGCTSLSMSQD